MSEKWKMVPVVMTDEMTEAARAALDLGEGYVETSCLDLDAAYEAAICAAPTNPQQDRISAIITRALLEGCDNHKDRADLARETARYVMEAKYRPLYRLSADGKVEPVPSYEDGVKEGLRRALEAVRGCEISIPLAIGAPDGWSMTLRQIEAAILSLLTKEEGK